MGVSVIIATFNRAALLAECLEHLRRQRFEPNDEVLVVDNGSTDGTLASIERAVLTFPVRLQCLRETTPGKSAAVAAAARAASGEILAFTDDDVNVDEGWLEAIRRAMADPRVALVGGPVQPRWEREPPRWLQAATATPGRLGAPLGLLDYGGDPSELGSRTAIGANMAVRREVFLRAGGFALHLGKLRGTLMSGEDHDLCRRVQEAGGRAVYIPDARVRHFVPAARMRVSYYLSWFFWSGITNAAIDGNQAPIGRTVLGVPLYLVRRMGTGGAIAIASAVTGNVARAVERGIDVAFAAGYAMRCWRLPSGRVALTSHGGRR
jgi:glucosyl-dolichyl phosphate glucuronosyltransferase